MPWAADITPGDPEDHARRTLLMHAQRLAQTATDATLPNRAVATLAQADTLAQFMDTLAGQFAPHPGSLPRTVLPKQPTARSSEEALDEERLLLATATAHPAALKAARSAPAAADAAVVGQCGKRAELAGELVPRQNLATAVRELQGFGPREVAGRRPGGRAAEAASSRL
ncbi:hypothetical protein AB0I52_31760 [Streptomyces sp. NPDC050423]|uniref:hypothetical protein n=1 Tax=Streptomyces sp. NPDC050423 TaxID=3155402 RepID=UPI003415D2C8